MVKKTEIITDLEKKSVTVAYCAGTEQFGRRSTWNFSGQGTFFGNQCISINICLTTHKNVASQGKFLEFWLLDTLKIEKLKLNDKLNI